MAVSKEARIEAVKLLISEGWSPPPPSDKVVDWITKDMEELTDRQKLDLTPTQLRLLRLAADGHTTHEQAEMTDSTFHTVRQHRKEMLRRLGARNMPHAVALYYRNGRAA